ncbi:GNAT family N-acetyltransferase [Nocardioides marmoraquaticus]
MTSGGFPAQGEGLVLRALAPGDRDRVLELAHDPLQLALGVPAGVPVPGDLEQVDERVTGSAAALGALQPGRLAVAAQTDPDRFLGELAWRHGAHPTMGVVDVGYAVHPDARGTGVASRALRLLVRWLLHDPEGPGAARVQLDHSVDNAASCRVALAAGMEQEGVRRSYLPLRDPEQSGGVRRHDVCLHGIVPG